MEVSYRKGLASHHGSENRPICRLTLYNEGGKQYRPCRYGEERQAAAESKNGSMPHEPLLELIRKRVGDFAAVGQHLSSLRIG